MKTIWNKSRKWKNDQLDVQTVQFRLRFPTWTAEGVGKFLIQGNGVQKMAVGIVVPHFPQEDFDRLYHLSDERVERIAVNPDQAKARFRLWE